MEISFIDESGIGGNSKFFILGLISINEEACKSIKKKLLLLKTEHGIPPHVEIKWNLNDFNKHLAKNSLPTYTLRSHMLLKRRVMGLLDHVQPNEMSILWYLSPVVFFEKDPWRSYQYALSDCLKRLSGQQSKQGKNSIALIDELGYLGIKKEDRKKLLEDLVLQVELEGFCESTVLIVPNTDSTVSFGHQINDIILGLINSYLIDLHTNNLNGRSRNVIKALNDLGSKFGITLIIKPSLPKSSELVLLIEKTNSNLRKDLDKTIWVT